MDEQQTPASVVEREPVSNPYKLAEASKAFLTEAARYFETRPTGGEDAAHWSNVFNAKNCREAATLIERLSAEREEAVSLLRDIVETPRAEYSAETAADSIRAFLAALTQGESRQTGWRDADTLATLLDNVVIAQSLSRELREQAHDAARSYLYNRRQARAALPAAPTPADGGGE